MAQVIRLNDAEFALMIERMVVETLQKINEKKLNEVAPALAAAAGTGGAAAGGTAAAGGASGAAASGTSGVAARGAATGSNTSATNLMTNMANGGGREPGDFNSNGNNPQKGIGDTLKNSAKNVWNHAVKSFGIGDRLRQRGYNVNLTSDGSDKNVSISRDEYNKFQNMKQTNPDLYNSASTNYNNGQ